jgi:hypothetical protein
MSNVFPQPVKPADSKGFIGTTEQLGEKSPRAPLDSQSHPSAAKSPHIFIGLGGTNKIHGLSRPCPA